VRKLKSENIPLRSRIALKRFENQVNRKTKKYGRYKGEQVQISIFGHKIIYAPERICLYSANSENDQTYIETMKFVSKLNSVSKSEKIFIDFKSTIRVEAAALLMLYATIDNLIKEKDIKFRFSVPKENSALKKLLKSSYIYRLMNRSQIDYDFNNRRQLPVITGFDNQYVDHLLDYIMEFVYSDSMDPENEHTFGDAIQETVHNVGLHAYPDRDDREKQWWLLCQVIDNQLYLAIYDLGVGIPKTIVKQSFFMARLQNVYPKLYEQVMNISRGLALDSFIPYLVTHMTDAEAINLSMQPDVSSRKQDKHGQGSKSIKKLVDDTDGGKLWIFSNSGLYFKPQGQEPGLKPLRKPFIGTLVQWNINLK